MRSRGSPLMPSSLNEAAAIACALVTLVVASVVPAQWVWPQELSTRALVADLENADWQVRRAAATQLGESASEDREVVAALGAALDDVDSRVRRASATALGEIGPGAARATRALVARLDDQDPQVSLAATRALGLIGRRASRAARDVESLLAEPDAELRLTAADSLNRMGRSTSEAVAALSGLLSHPDARIRTAAAEALGRIGERAGLSGAALIELLGDDDSEVRTAAAEALGDLGESVVPMLIAALTSGNPVYLQAVVEALRSIGPPAVPALVGVLEDDDRPPLQRQYAARALARIGNARGDVVPALVERLDDENPQIRIAAAESLGNLGNAADGARGRLIEVIEDSDEELPVREYAIAAVARIAPAAPEVAATLVEAVADSNATIYEAAVAALVEIGIADQQAAGNEVAEWVDSLQSADPSRRLIAARRLGELGPYARAAVSALTETLADAGNDLELRTAAAIALGEIGSAAEPALPVLIDTLRNADAAPLTGAALVAMRRIGPQTRTIPALMEALRDSDLGVRGSAASAIRNFALARLQGWQGLLAQSDAPVLRAWLSRHDELYGIGEQSIDLPGRSGELRVTDYFDVLGGRAAIRESVQLQTIETQTQIFNDLRTIPISSVEGIDIPSHPYEDMLEASRHPPGSLALSDFAPSDRLFVYFRDVSAMAEFLRGSADIFFRLESTFSIKSFSYELAPRTLARLGLTESSLTQLESMGAIRDFALVVPDLFFLEGTEITAIVRAASADFARAVLELAGVEDADGVTIGVATLESGQEIHWAHRGELLFLSTNRDELASVLEIHDNDRRAGLGQSPEFQYMLQQLPLAETTQAYFYFSDPFIRRLVSPQTKIAQLRRMRARAELEMLTAGAMLYKLDGHTAAPNKERLIQLGYVPAEFAERDYEIGDDFVARSQQFGTPAALRSLISNPVQTISRAEASAYEEYLRNYTAYWRQFFDPIALRLDKLSPGTLELTTFISPLLDSDLYNEVENALTSAGSGLRLQVPELDPAPYLSFSVNLSDSMRLSLAATLTDILEEFTTLSPDIFDALSSTIHIAVQDSSPIVAVGSGDILGALSEDLLRLEGFEPFLPVLLSLVSQPASVLIELAEPDAVLSALKSAVVRRGNGTLGELHQLQGQDAWIYTLNLLDLVQVHLRVAVEGDYLVVSNLPWSPKGIITAVNEDSLNAARLDLDFAAISELLPALHTKAYRDYRVAAIDGIGYLYPLLASGLADTVDEAEARHLELFGSRPVHPSSGQWQWSNGELSSSMFGTVTSPVQPAFSPGDRDFGLFPMLDRLRVSMQLEETGLRARIRWQLAAD